MSLPEIEHLSDQRVDPPEEEDFDAEQEAREREGEIQHDIWQEDGYPERNKP